MVHSCTSSEMANVQGIDKIQDSLGYLVLTEEGAVISSGGDLQNAETLADGLTKLVFTASRIPVSPDRRETFQKISVIWEDFMYVITVSNHKIYICKRPYSPQDPAIA
ncbi:ragulator complex protein LAMTOR4 homolog isoform X1 [Saccostrea cucullata]|uniref:ragulator complex protein LAMTOR4 homolog isoform X1 n=2 Tax=Saccostrea cuccullata TaxID=36930 RepID=UPI002ED54DA6